MGLNVHRGLTCMYFPHLPSNKTNRTTKHFERVYFQHTDDVLLRNNRFRLAKYILGGKLCFSTHLNSKFL